MHNKESKMSTNIIIILVINIIITDEYLNINIITNY